MATYIILSQVYPGAFKDPKEFKQMAATVIQKTKVECPGVVWKESFVTMGRFDIVDIVECNDPRQLEKALMIIRGYGHSMTETMEATSWKDFLARL